MRKTRKLVASLFVGGMLAAGSVALAQPATASHVSGCPDTLGTVVHGSGRYGATWTINNKLIDWTSTKCKYRGDKYSVSYGGQTVYQGKYDFWRPRG